MAMLWVDKHRPKAFDEMDYHAELSARLKRIAASRDQPHMLITGPSGAGKSTRVHALLRELYGPGADLVKVETRSVTPNPNVPSNTVDIQVLVSNYHLQVTPSDLGNKDHAVVMQLIKEVAAHPPLGGHTFKVVVIDEAGSLSATAQAALRRTMERYMKTCRIILTCESSSKVIPPLRSRCLAIRVSAPSAQDVQKVVMKVADKEGVKCAPELAQRIAEKSERDMRRALLMLETVYTQTNSKNLAGNLTIPQEAWDPAIERIAKKIIQEQSPRIAMEVRGNVYELMAACLPPDFILAKLLEKLLLFSAPARGGDELQRQTIAAAAHFESTMRQGSKDIFHVEAFVLRFMADYRAASTVGGVGASQR